MFNCFIDKGDFLQANHDSMPIINKFKTNYKGFFPPNN